MTNSVPQSILDAADQLRRHVAVSKVEPPVAVETGGFRVIAEVTVELPSRAKAKGFSATGVLPRELIVLDFGKDWPSSAPVVGLRKDFPLSFPHINPHTKGDFVRPCIYAGSVSELMHREGFDKIVDQTVDWLCKAASNTLISNSQGWEPTRRDETAGALVFDAERIIALLPEDGSVVRLPSNFTCFEGLRNFVVNSNPDSTNDFWYVQEVSNDLIGRWVHGQTCTFLAGPANDKATGAQPIVAVYESETVTTLDDLREKAKRLGIDDVSLIKSLERYFSGSQHASKTFSWPDGFMAGVILAVRRPIPLISSFGRCVELLPYIVRHTPLPSRKSFSFAAVEPAIHQQSLAPKVLRDVSGTSEASTKQPLAWLGAGSLGSKVALHLAKEGYGNQTFIDNDAYSPHNAARHALVERTESAILPYKSYLMAYALKELGHHDANGWYQDAVRLLASTENFKKYISANAVLVDTTASLRVMEAACASQALDRFGGRYVRTSMLGQGKVCFAALESTGRGARVDDLMATMYAHCRQDETLRKCIANNNVGHANLFVGQNCSSSTTILPDSKVSRAAVSVAIQLEYWLENGFPKTGALAVGIENDCGVGLTWKTLPVGATKVLKVTTGGGWEIRVLANVVNAIEADVGRWRPSEAGGALLGHIYPGRRCIVVGDFVDAPADSVRSPMRFMLGTEKLEEQLKQAHQETLGHLHFVGTWHSHPTGGPLSSIDLRTLRNLAQGGQGLPAISLVWTPQGFLCEVLSRNQLDEPAAFRIW